MGTEDVASQYDSSSDEVSTPHSSDDDGQPKRKENDKREKDQLLWSN